MRYDVLKHTKKLAPRQYAFDPFIKLQNPAFAGVII
jgi:hypothetical protein